MIKVALISVLQFNYPGLTHSKMIFFISEKMIGIGSLIYIYIFNKIYFYQNSFKLFNNNDQIHIFLYGKVFDWISRYLVNENTYSGIGKPFPKKGASFSRWVFNEIQFGLRLSSLYNMYFKIWKYLELIISLKI